jgi:hypothetical protein
VFGPDDVADSHVETDAPIFPIGNETKPIPEPTDSSCVADCRVRYPELLAISWVPEVQIVYTTEVTVGTVSIYNTISQNSTSPPRTHTVFNVDVPAEYSLWMVRSDPAGTAFLEVPLTIDGSHTLKTLVYPTPWLDYPSEYHWEGVLPTTGKRAEPVCVTATELDVAVLNPHPAYPQPTLSPNEADPSGASYRPLWVPVQDLPDKKWFDGAFPSVSAFASCESVPGKPAPTEFSAPRFIFETISIVSNATRTPVGVILSSETGFEDTRTTKPATSTKITGQEGASNPGSKTLFPSGPHTTQHTGPHFMSTETGFEDRPDAHQTAPPPEITGGPKTQGPGGIGSIINNNNRPPVSKPSIVPSRPVVPAPAVANPTPVFTLVPTVINGKPTAVPAFLLPGSSALASVGERVTINGEPTVLTAPAAMYTMVPTIIGGVSTSLPVYIISGSITATIGQTVTLDGQPTVLSAPAPVPTMIPTIINGVPTSIPAYIISGSITAFPGQTVIVGGQPTVLPMHDAVYTGFTTTVDGKATVIQAYIISGSITATLGQTVTIDGTTTVLSTPTGTDAIDTRFGGPATTSFGGQAQQPKSSKGVRIRAFTSIWKFVFPGLVAFGSTLL